MPVIVEVEIDHWEWRSSIAETLRLAAALLTTDTLLPLFRFMIHSALADRSANVRQDMLAAG